MISVKKAVLIFIVTLGILFSYTAVAESQDQCLVQSSPLLNKRIVAIKEYLSLVGQGKYKETIPFFTANAMVSDTVVGLKTAQDYYTQLYAYLTDPHMTLYDIYVGLNNPNVLAAHFNMKIKTKNGIENRGEIVDLFVFEKDSTKIKKIYIQGNKTDFSFSEN